MVEKFIPGRQFEPVKDRKERFWEIVAFVTDRGGWVTSIPGDVEITVECLPSSNLPSELEAAGWQLKAAGEGERLIPGSIEERFALSARGELVPQTAGSTRPVALVQRHAGFVRIHRYVLS